ncbi:MAG: ABC transporter ATP-binding protein [Candidatus Aminicenantales bacterium]
MIEVRGLCKSFDGTAVLEGVDLAIPEGRTTVILGPSGQGKTVLIKCLVRLLEPDRGSVRFGGTDILSLSREPLRKWRRQTAFVFQENALFDFVDIRENLSLYLRMHGRMPESVIAREVENALAYVGLGPEVLDRFPEDLSGGMKKRVAIARALLQKPGYLFFDEPTAGLDDGNSRKVRDLIRAIHSESAVTIVVVTHDLDLMRGVADRVVTIREGRIGFEGTPDEVGDAAIHDLYQGREDVS